VTAFNLTDLSRPYNEVQVVPAPVAFPGGKSVDLAGARAAVLGCGSVGGFAAWCLAGAGVTDLELADRDRLEIDNCRRHLCGATDQGQPKAAAVAAFLHAHFRQVTATCHDFCFLQRPERLRGLIERCDIALVAVDDEAPKYLIDAMARELGRPAVYAGVYGGGWGVEAIFHDPAIGSPCYGCTAQTLGRIGIAVSPPPPGSDYALPDATTDPSEWARADLTSILPCATLAARLVTAWLARQRGSEQAWREFQAPAANAWRLALRHVPAWGFGPWELRPVPVQRQPGCPECGGRTGSLADFDRLLSGGPL
jgi:molybdopterin/thiamine biosynthesis adenylyltransferase